MNLISFKPQPFSIEPRMKTDRHVFAEGLNAPREAFWASDSLTVALSGNSALIRVHPCPSVVELNAPGLRELSIPQAHFRLTEVLIY